MKLLQGCMKGCLISFCVLLNACSTEVESFDSAPSKAQISKVNFDAIPNATPKVEPRSRYGNPDHYTVLGKTYYVADSAEGYDKRGYASWYGTKFHGQRTSSGEPYDMFAMTAANKTLPLPSYVEVTNLNNHKKVIVKVNDRGPFHEDRIIDLSYAAAKKLGMLQHGTAYVEVKAIDPKKHLEDIPNYKDYYLQAGVFSEQENAVRYASKIAKLTQRHTEVTPDSIYMDDEGHPLYRVEIGPIANLNEEDSINDILAKAGLHKAVLSNRT